MGELERNEFGVVVHHPDEGILELEWLEGSSGLTDDEFMASMQRYSELAETQRPPYLLVDVTRFRFSPGPQVAAWRDEHVIPGYNRAGVKKFAFLVAEGGDYTVEAGHPPAIEPPGEFPTGVFDRRQDILEWFRA